MKTSRPIVLAAAAAAVASSFLALSASADANNPYAGEWCGTFELVGDEEPAIQGTVEWSITAAGT